MKMPKSKGKEDPLEREDKFLMLRQTIQSLKSITEEYQKRKGRNETKKTKGK